MTGTTVSGMERCIGLCQGPRILEGGVGMEKKQVITATAGGTEVELAGTTRGGVIQTIFVGERC